MPVSISISLIGFTMLMMFSIGLKTSMDEIASVFRQRSFLFRAILTNLIIVPLFAFLITAFLPFSSSTKCALLLLAAMPGAPLGLQFTAAMEQSRSKAAVLTFLFSLFAILVSPLYAQLLSFQLSARFAIPLVRVTLLLPFYIVLPLLIGLLIRRHKAGTSRLFLKIVDVLCFLFFIVAFFVTSEVKSSAIKQIAGGGNLVALVIFFIGSFLAGWILGRNNEEKRFFAALSSMRNIVVAFVVASISFPAQNVDLAIVAYFALMLPPNAVMMLVQRWKMKVHAEPRSRGEDS